MLGVEMMDPLVTPDPSPEAIELMRYLHGISGKQILTGQPMETE
jgi:hypothetical protein